MEKNKLVPEGVRLITWATSLRWFGWGFVETLIPIFLFSFGHSYADTGILRSIYGIVFLLVLPFVAWFANRVQSKYLLMAGLLMYPFISLSYFFAGSFGLIALVIVARILNGAAYALDSIGRDTYIRTHTNESNNATSFGYFDTLTNFWWLLAVVISLVLVKWIAIKYLFLAILPTALLAIFFIRKIPSDHKILHPEAHSLSFLSSYREFFHGIFQWNGRLFYLTALLFLIDSIWVVISFFVPIYAYAQGESLVRVMALTAFVAFPSLLSLPLGIFADKKWKATIPISFAMVSLLLFLLTRTTNFSLQLVCVFAAGVFLQFLNLAINAEATGHVEIEKSGSLSAGLQGAGQLAEIVAPILLGISIDRLHFSNTVLIVAGLIIVVMLPPLFLKKLRIRNREVVIQY